MNFNNTSLKALTLHFVGNKNVDGRLFSSPDTIPLSEDITEKLNRFYLRKFEELPDRYRFYHTSSLQFNEVYNFVSEVFENHDFFESASKKIAGHLFEKSVHPNIKPGELHVCLFTDCLYNSHSVDAIGIFKTEDKSGFFEIAEIENRLSLEYREGVDINKFDKGCLVFNIAEDTGYEVCVIDRQNKGEEAKYWMDEFLGLMQISNDFSQTNDILSLTKNYITQQFAEEFQVNKTDQIELLNRSIDYFKSHEMFDKEEFENDVFHHPDTIQSFRHYETQYLDKNEMELEDGFAISAQAVKKQTRVFKSVLKLDRNFHIYIHGNKELIERGVDSDGRKYYKIYFENEE